jgi:TRAP-type mannitol/chloroaromatic compound transport system permease large subunit
MDIGTISLLLLLGLFFLLAIGMPLGLASAILAVFVLVMKFEPALLSNPLSFGCPDWYTEANPGARCILTGRPGAGPLNILQQKIYGVLTSYVLISVPLFIFMASLLEKSGIAKDMYASLNVWLSRTRGGIAIVTSIMAVIMAAMSGIIGGEVVLLGLIALPQMLKLGYNQNLAIGTICASGSLGTMIPPSIVLIMYGLITETSIKALFTAPYCLGDARLCDLVCGLNRHRPAVAVFYLWSRTHQTRLVNGQGLGPAHRGYRCCPRVDIRRHHWNY